MMLRARARVVLLCLFAAVLSVRGASQCSATSYTYSTTGTERNPLRGFAVWASSSANKYFPVSLEYANIGIDTMMSGPSTFTFDTSVEPLLKAIAARGNQAVIRPVLDIPGSPSNVPPFLLTGTGAVTMTAYTNDGGGKSPDYTNARLLAALQAFFAALGAKYDADPRLAYFEIGTLGYWGEWHTYPNDNLWAPYTTQQLVLKAFSDAFKTTPGLISQDQLSYWDTTTPAPTVMQYNIGWFDDSFAGSTYLASGAPDYYTYPHLVSHNAQNRWKQVPMGGEVLPSLQDTIFTAGYSTNQPYLPCVANVHPVFLLNGRVGDSISGTEYTNAVAGHVALGYQYHIQAVRVTNPDSCSSGASASSKCVQVAIDLTNKGSTPFYYPLYLSVVAGGKAFNTTDMRSLLPGTVTTYTIEVSFAASLTGTLAATISLYSPNVLPALPIKFTTTGAGAALAISLDTTCAHAVTAASPPPPPPPPAVVLPPPPPPPKSAPPPAAPPPAAASPPPASPPPASPPPSSPPPASPPPASPPPASPPPAVSTPPPPPPPKSAPPPPPPAVVSPPPPPPPKSAPPPASPPPASPPPPPPAKAASPPPPPPAAVVETCASSYASIKVDGSFSDWSSVPQVYSGASQKGGVDVIAMSVANDDTYLYIKLTLAATATEVPFSSYYSHLFFDTDGNKNNGYTVTQTGFKADFMIESGTGYDERTGAFNAGQTSALAFKLSPSSKTTVYELRIARAATYSGGASVFPGTGGICFGIAFQDNRQTGSAVRSVRYRFAASIGARSNDTDGDEPGNILTSTGGAANSGEGEANPNPTPSATSASGAAASASYTSAAATTTGASGSAATTTTTADVSSTTGDASVSGSTTDASTTEAPGSSGDSAAALTPPPVASGAARVSGGASMWVLLIALAVIMFCGY